MSWKIIRNWLDKNIYNFMNVFYLWSFCTKSIILPKSFSLQTYFKIIHTKSRNESCFYRINVGLHIGRKSNIFCLVAKNYLLTSKDFNVLCKYHFKGKYVILFLLPQTHIKMMFYQNSNNSIRITNSKYQEIVDTITNWNSYDLYGPQRPKA